MKIAKKSAIACLVAVVSCGGAKYGIIRGKGKH